MSKMKEYLLNTYETCDCSEVCGWTKSHGLEKEGEWWVCANCGVELDNPEQLEQVISFDCAKHGAVDWVRV